MNPWLSPSGSGNAIAFYDTAPLRQTLSDLVDFDGLNSCAVHYAAGAVNVVTGYFAYFDSAWIRIVPEHVLTSSALPPAFASVHIGTDHYWDDGLVSNTPLRHVLDIAMSLHMLIFQVVCSARGASCRATWTMCWLGRTTSSTPAAHAW